MHNCKSKREIQVPCQPSIKVISSNVGRLSRSDDKDELMKKVKEQEEMIRALEEDLDIYERKIVSLQEDSRDLWAMVKAMEKKLDKCVEDNDNAINNLTAELDKHKQFTKDKFDNIKPVNHWHVNNSPMNTGGWTVNYTGYDEEKYDDKINGGSGPRLVGYT